MIRLILAMLVAVGLALSPAAPAMATISPGAMPGCTMGDDMPAQPADHSKMDCCTPACQFSSAAALLPQPSSAMLPLKADGGLQPGGSGKELVSFLASGLDPPPRLSFLK